MAEITEEQIELIALAASEGACAKAVELGLPRIYGAIGVGRAADWITYASAIAMADLSYEADLNDMYRQAEDLMRGEDVE